MCFVGVTNLVSTHLVFVVIFCLLNAMVVLQAKQILKLQLQWFFFLHFFSRYANLVDYRSLALKKLILGV